MIYGDIQNMTNEEAVSYYGPLTKSYIPCGDLENLLGYAGLASRNPVTGAWEGSLIDFMNSNAVPALSAGLVELFSHLNKPRSIGCDTHEQPWASKMSDLLAGLIVAGVIDDQFKADVIALAGGLAYPLLDAPTVQAVRDEEAAEVALKASQDAIIAIRQGYDSKYNEYIAPVLGNLVSTEADLKAALEAMAASYGA